MNAKEVIEVLEQNNITLALMAETETDKELARTQIEMNNLLINQLKMMLAIESNLPLINIKNGK